MCGIIGYIGYREVYPILINGLKKLEYRGYDSSGIAIIRNNGYSICKTKGRIYELEKKISYCNLSVKGNIGIGHTRWATHGIPNDINAHPHISNSKDLIIIHNGIIDNYHAIKIILSKHGFTFKSKTDTEVLVNFIEYVKKIYNVSLEESVRISLKKIIGTYSIAILDKSNPDTIIIAKFGSPLVIGVGKKELFISSDPIPFIDYTNNILYMKDGEMAIIRKNQEIDLRNINNNKELYKNIQKLNINAEETKKGTYKYFTLKEICEQPKTILNTIKNRILYDKNNNEKTIIFNELKSNIHRFINAKSIIIIACGTSWHSGLIGEFLLERFTRIPVEVEYASEFRYRNPIIRNNDVVICISQSGETADTISALKLAKKQKAFTVGICNVTGSFISRNVDVVTYTYAGPEIGVASTKSFTSQIVILILLSIKIGLEKKIITHNCFTKLCYEIESIPEKINSILNIYENIKNISKKYYNVNNILYLGRGINFPVALEGALKLKEISYIHSEGLPAAEMKHGPIALIDHNMPVVVIATQDKYYDKIIGNIQEIKARKGKIIAIVNERNFQIKKLSNHSIIIPTISEYLSPLLTVIPLQLLAYQIACMKGKNIDKPRNLAKSVTVE